MITIRAFYFIYYAAAASLIPFLTLYYQGLGLTGREIGILTSVAPLLTLVGASVWSAVGWGIAAALTGWLLQRTVLNWIFYTYLVLLLVLLVIAFRLPIQQTGIKSNFWSGLRQLLTNRRWLRRGTPLLLAVSLAFMVIRVFAYASMTAAWQVLLISLLHGPTFSAMWSAGVAYADETAVTGLSATAQGVFSGTVLGLGAALGAVVGGFLYDSSGAVKQGALHFLKCAAPGSHQVQ